ncbi:putative beta-1,3-glucan-binding protein precursor [Saitoella complicata NRRL Y-17804]|uniref:putative beta-1,3-glucan-binding protein precursor n=1 Tax=Saitoella complicata (strain BCRC 22490 / CBS 7301 / JCM 7358 / NBRC 10748 / NRRL Y-17804) TaxID=698492 RepID=UPI000866AD6B|nr:putative beta-1,3-glucan-binding protein precursor [Saitoella complicata NRRL Y-17804]ODQ52804.1 putative beta-1,3-glucan-binding protein precursor [Saitoella complicata NRRL Y-17804]
MFPKPFVSRRLHEPINKTGWEKETKNHWRLMQTLPWVGILIGLLASAFIGWWGWQSVPESTYQLILDENFSAGAIDPTIWNHEVQLNGFGTGNFDWTTTDSRNSYVKDGMLHIVPTLTSDVLGFDAITNGYTVNITGNGCTSESASDCAAVSNSTLGDVLPPVQSARLNTKGHYGIKYGKVEVVAKMPVGDWIWPAIWMMPRDSVYGEWPRSGEIDIAEARGNKPDFGLQGRDYVSSTIHWGPSGDLNKYYKTSNVIQQLHGDFSQDFHTYAIEWTPRYIFAYVDSRLRQGLSVKFNKKFWDRGNFDVIDKTNLTIIDNPWDVANATDSTPFDQDFYLILNVAVGGTNAYFADDMPGKPWADKSPTAKSDFWTARNSWYPTWLTEEERGMVVKSVKMYQWLGSERQYF